MDDEAHGSVVTEGEQLLPGGIASVPAAERGGGLVREHDVVLVVVEDGLGAKLLERGRVESRNDYCRYCSVQKYVRAG